MSQSIVLAMPENIPFQSLADQLTQKYHEAFSHFEKQHQIKKAKGYVSISKMKHQQAVKDEYLEITEYDSNFLKVAASCVYYMLTFNDFELIKEVIITLLSASVLRPDECWIDTDYGWVFSGSEFMQRLKLDPSWDWRYKYDNVK